MIRSIIFVLLIIFSVEVYGDEMKISHDGIEMLKHHEGERNDVYDDGVGILTVGIGHALTSAELKKWKLGDKITDSQVMSLFRKDIKWAEDAVDRHVDVEINQKMFDALVSFVFNIGSGNFEDSTLLRKLNDKDYSGAAKEFDRWIYAQGKRLNGLVKRRNDEEEMFRDGMKDMQITESLRTIASGGNPFGNIR